MGGWTKARRRRWADILVIAVGVFEFAIALWGAGHARPGGSLAEIERIGWYWATTGLSGTLAIVAVFVALRHATVGRVLVALSGLILLSALFAFESINGRAILTVILPALVLLATLPFFGPMPTPEQEGMRR